MYEPVFFTSVHERSLGVWVCGICEFGHVALKAPRGDLSTPYRFISNSMAITSRLMRSHMIAATGTIQQYQYISISFTSHYEDHLRLFVLSHHPATPLLFLTYRCTQSNWLLALQQQNGKDSRIRANKVNDYIQILSLFGKAAGEPYIKHLDGDIWELRPTRDRVLFAGWTDNGFVLLHHFMKKTQKTPKREIEQAKRELADWIERGGADEG